MRTVLLIYSFPLIQVTRSKAVDLQKKQTSRSVFQCYVFGPPGVGKVPPCRVKFYSSNCIVEQTAVE